MTVLPPSAAADAALALAAFATLLSALTLLGLRRAQARRAQQEAGHAHALLRRLDALDAGVLNTCEAVSQIAEAIERLGRPNVASGAAASYQVAIRLARSGASCEELVRDCGLSHTEAELVKRLHGARRAS